MKRAFLSVCLVLLCSTSAWSSGFGVFTQGASGLGQANAVVAHPTGPSSLYFNPALLNQVPGRQVEFGTTGIYAERTINLDSGGNEDSDTSWEFPSTFYYTHQANDKVAAGLGLFFPFGLSSEWDDNYEGRYIGTEGEIFTMNINPAVSFQVTDKLSLAVGLDFLYFDATLKNKINQFFVAAALPPQLGGPIIDPTIQDATQEFEGDAWGSGYNLGVLLQATERISIGATYRSHIDVDIDDGDLTYGNVDPRYPGLGFALRNEKGRADIRLPAQATAGVAVQILESLIVEAGLRWEDWDSTEKLEIRFDNPVLGQDSTTIPRDWSSTWTYNIGGQYQFNETVALNAGYLYGQNAVPATTFEPLIPDTDAHLFCLGTDLTIGAWTISGAFGWETHEDRDKNNTIGDPLGSAAAGQPVNTANGEYETDIYLVGLSVGYRF